MARTEPDFSRKLNVSLRARVTLIVVMTPEEERVVAKIKDVCETWDPPRQCIAWDAVDGYSVIAGNKNFHTQSRDPLAALDDIQKTDENAVVIFKDFHEYWNNPQVKRRIRNFSHSFKYNRRSIVIVTPVQRVPDPGRCRPRPLPATVRSRTLIRPRSAPCNERDRGCPLKSRPREDHPGSARDDAQPGPPVLLKSDRHKRHAR